MKRDKIEIAKADEIISEIERGLLSLKNLLHNERHQPSGKPQTDALSKSVCLGTSDQVLFDSYTTAKMLSIGEKTLRKYRQAGLINCIQVGRMFHFSQKHIDDFIFQNQTGSFFINNTSSVEGRGIS